MHVEARVCCRFVASRVAARNGARLGVGRRQWSFPCPSPTTTAGATSRVTRRAGPVFARCGVSRRLFGTTKLRSSCLASRKNRRRRGRARNGNRPLVPALDHSPGADHALERLAALVGGVEDGAVFQRATVLGGDQRALDHFLALAGLDVLDQQFVTHSSPRIRGKGGAFWQESGRLARPVAHQNDFTILPSSSIAFSLRASHGWP